MKLVAYRNQCGFTDATLAAWLGVDRTLVFRWLYDGLVPSPKHMLLIYQKTDGQVRPSQFYELPPLRPRSRRGRKRPASADALP